MSSRQGLILERRGLLQVSGPDRVSFLQGIVSNDVARAAAGQPVWSAFLTPQGKFLHEFFIVPWRDALLLDVEAERRADLLRRLSIYKLRSQAALEDVTGAYAVAVLFDAGGSTDLGLAFEGGATVPLDGGVAYRDPRLAALGARAVLPRDTAPGALAEAGFAAAEAADYDRLRISQGVPDGSRDLEVEKSILLENGFEELHGVDWDKGCFLGQELTARTKYRALIKKRLLPVTIDGPAPEPGTPVMAGAKEAGVMRSVADGMGLALIRLEHLDGAEQAVLTAGEARVTPWKPDWASF